MCDILWHFFSLPLTTLFSRASPSCNFSPQLRLANAVAVFLINVYLQLATDIASGKLRVLSSLGEYFFAFHCVLYTANSCLKQSVKLKTSLGSVTFNHHLSRVSHLMLSGSSKYTTYFSSIINLRCGRYFTFCV